MSERRPEEIKLVDELKELGRQLTATIQAVATSDDVRSLGRDLRDGLRAAAQHVEETVGEVRDHDEVQRLRVRAADVAGSFKTGEAQREIRTELEAALHTLNTRLRSVVEHMPATTPAADPPRPATPPAAGRDHGVTQKLPA